MGVYFGLVVVQVLVGVTFAYNTNLETGELSLAVSPIDAIVLNVLLFSPSLIALGLVIWMLVAMAHAKRHAPAEDPTAGVTPGAGPPPDIAAAPATQRKRRTIIGVLIGAATFLLTCGGPCVGPSVVSPLTTPNPTPTTWPLPEPYATVPPEDWELYNAPSPPASPAPPPTDDVGPVPTASATP